MIEEADIGVATVLDPVGDSVGRRPRQDKGQVRLTERDLWALQWIGEQYAVRFDQLQGLLGRDPQGTVQVEGLLTGTTTRRVLRRWVSGGFVRYQKLLVREPGWIWLTRRGLADVGLPYRLYVPGPAWLNHLYWVNAARALTEARRPEATWVSERALRYQMEVEAQDDGQRGSAPARRLLPDAQVEIDEQTVIAVEVELSLKTASRLKNIVVDRTRRYAGVWYFVTPQTRGLVSTVVAGLEPQVQSKVRLIDLAQ